MNSHKTPSYTEERAESFQIHTAPSPARPRRRLHHGPPVGPLRPPSQPHLPNGLSGLVELLQHALHVSVDLAGAPIHGKCAPATRRGLLRPQGSTSACLGSTPSWIPSAPSACQQLKEMTRVQTRVGAQLSALSALEQQDVPLA